MAPVSLRSATGPARRTCQPRVRLTASPTSRLPGPASSAPTPAYKRRTRSPRFFTCQARKALDAAGGVICLRPGDPPAGEKLFEAGDWAACFESQENEFGCAPVARVDGKLPSDLVGTLFRVTPGSSEIGSQKVEHWLDGDGYVMAFTFLGERGVRFQSRYVETPERVAEQRAGKVLYRNTFGTQPAGINAGDLRLKNPANTNVVVWGGKLLALWEAGCPYELDPNTLETIGASDIGQWLTIGSCPSTTGSRVLDKALGFGEAHTAHPHAMRGAMGEERLVSWKWSSFLEIPGGPSLRAEFHHFLTTDSIRRLEIPRTPMAPHDFAVTASSYVMTVPPMVFNMLPYLAGVAGPAQCVSLARDAPMRILIIPRVGGAATPVTEIKEEPVYYIHYANAFDDGDVTVLRGSAWGPDTVKRLAENPGGGILGSWADILEGNFSAPVTSLWEHRINRKTHEVSRRLLYETSMDHPCVNPWFYGKENRYTYFSNCVSGEPGKSAPPQAWSRLDTKTGEVQQVYFGPRCFTEELKFVPREGSDKREDWGYLLGLLYSAEEDRSALMVLDASDFGKGAICTIWLEDRFPHGLHGHFTPQTYGAY